MSSHDDAARRDAQRAALDPNSVEAMADLLRNEGDLDGAKGLYDSLIEQHPNIARYYFGRAQASTGIGNHRAAVADYVACLRLAPHHAESWFQLGALQVHLGDVEQGVSSLERACNEDGLLAAPRARLGLALAQMGQSNDALAAFSEAIRLCPGAGLLYVYRARIRMLLRQWSKSLLDLGAAVELGVNDTGVEKLRAISYVMAQSNGEHDDKSPSVLVGMDDTDRRQHFRTITMHDAQPGSMRKDQARIGAPLQPVAVRACQVETGLRDLASAAIEYAFPAFLGRTALHAGPALSAGFLRLDSEMARHGIHLGSPSLERKKERARYLRRRYSGDTHADLARRQYYALQGGRRLGIAYYTLVAELNSYSIIQRTGYCVATHDQEGIKIRLRGLPQEPNPLFEARGSISTPSRFALDGGAPTGLTIPADNEIDVQVSPKEESLTFERALDLRNPRARAWLLQFLRDPPPTKSDDDFGTRGLAKVHRRGDGLRSLVDQVLAITSSNYCRPKARWKRLVGHSRSSP